MQLDELAQSNPVTDEGPRPTNGSSMIVGYTAGVFDLFHIGHLNLLRNARAMCDKLIVGVSTDEVVQYKFKRAVIPFAERMEIIRSIRYVDAVIPQQSLDKFEVWSRLKFDILFVGDDWYQSNSWQAMEERFASHGIKVVYFPYTKGTSSTLITEVLHELRRDA